MVGKGDEQLFRAGGGGVGKERGRKGL